MIDNVGSWRLDHIEEAELDSLGCPHCRDNEFDTLGEPGGAHEFRISHGRLYYYDEQRGWEGEQINFCPWCGKPLEMEIPVVSLGLPGNNEKEE